MPNYSTKEQALIKELKRIRELNRNLKLEIESLRRSKMSLVQYLSQLNSAESQWGIWVNPKDLDDYRIGQFVFENGGLLDEKVCIGSLEDLSFGFQPEEEALRSFLTNCYGRFKPGVLYRGKEVRVNIDGIVEAYQEGALEEELYSFLKENVDEICKEWAKNQAELKVEELQEYFAPSGEWEQEQEQLVLADA